MPSNVISRKTVREAIGALIDASSNFGADWDVFDYKTPVFNGKAKNIVVSSAGSRPEIMGAGEVTPDIDFRFRVYVFVLYSLEPKTATNNPTAGINKVITLTDTTNFIVGKTVKVENADSPGTFEYAEITAVNANASITVATLANSYTRPYVYAWTAKHSEDELDTAGKNLADLFEDNKSAANWNRLYFDGESNADEIVDEGGQTFRREIFTIRTEHTPA
jgi:hypothetical protein